MVIKSLFRLVTFFLSIPCRLVSFFTTYKALLIGLSVKVYFYTGVVVEVIGKT